MMPTTQQFLRSKTIWLSMALSALGVLQASMDAFTPYISPQSAGLISVGVGAAVAMLRILTSQPLSDK